MSGRIREFTVTLTSTGGAGAATATGATTESVEGYFEDVYLNFHASAPATTDTTIKQTSRSDNILVVTSSATDALYSPRQAIHTAAAAAITDGSARYPVNGTITVSVAQADALTGVLVATIRIQTL